MFIAYIAFSSISPQFFTYLQYFSPNDDISTVFLPSNPFFAKIISLGDNFAADGKVELDVVGPIDSRPSTV